MHDVFDIDRRTALRFLAGSLALGALGRGAAVRGEVPRVLAEGELPGDERLGPLRDLNAYFPFEPPTSVDEWKERAEEVRRRVLLSAGLWPKPEPKPIEATVHGPVERDAYVVWKVFFESSPGLFVTGNLYKPKEIAGKIPGILCPHGHWPNGRFHDHGEQRVAKEIEQGAEKFEVGGRHPIQARCATLARMGCLVFNYDMLGYADSAPITYEVAHRHAKQRPELNDPERWGLFSAQAELRLLTPLGIQTLNSLRALDWVASLDEVDPDRIGVTGSSGGGTQTFMLTAIDDRIDAAFPAVMVSTAMQGGCTCENAPYLRIGTGNVEFAALTAPRPLGLTAANDWTKEIETKGLPELKQLYGLLGVPNRVEGKYFPFGHNYNYVSRAMMYEFFNEHFDLGHESPIAEEDYQPLSREQLSVWNDEHPKPESDVAAEVQVLRKLDAASDRRLKQLVPADRKSLAEYRRVLGGALETMIGRDLPEAGAVAWDKREETAGNGYLHYTGLLRLKEHGEVLPATFFYPEVWKGHVAVWIHEDGKAGLYRQDGSPVPAVQALLEKGVSVAALDLLYQGEFLKDGRPLEQWRKVKNDRQAAAYTLGYNHPLFAQRVHDVLTMTSFVTHHEHEPKSVSLVGLGRTVGPITAAAAARAGKAVDRVAVGTGGFRFGTITDWRDPMLWPGAVKYGDVPFLLSLCAPTPLWLAGEKQLPRLVQACYGAAQAKGAVTRFDGRPQDAPMAAAKWIAG